jgi:hypothetical protein
MALEAPFSCELSKFLKGVSKVVLRRSDFARNWTAELLILGQIAEGDNGIRERPSKCILTKLGKF